MLLDEPMIVRPITDFILKLLDSNAVCRSGIYKRVEPYIAFVNALRQPIPADELVALYRQIKYPCFNAFYELAMRLLGFDGKSWEQSRGETGGDQSVESCVRREIVALAVGFETQNITPNQKLALASVYAAAGRFDQAVPQVEQAYITDAVVADGYSRIAWLYFGPNKDYDSIKIWTTCDYNLKRMSSAGVLRYSRALAFTDGMAAASPVVEEAYARSPDFRNVFSGLAWSLFIAKDSAYDKAIPYFERDACLGRLCGDWRLNYAQALAVVGRMDDSERAVETAYADDPKLVNGFARCAFSAHLIFNFAPDRALPWIDRDRRQCRLKNGFIIIHAALLAALGDLDGALAKVAEAYDSDELCVNGYAMVAWYYYVAFRRDLKAAMQLFERDDKLGRLRPNMGIYLAALHAGLGEREQSEAIVENNYRDDENIVGGYALAGLCDYIVSKDFGHLRKMFEKDLGIGRLSHPPFLSYIYAAVLLKDGDAIRAAEFTANSARQSSLSQSYAVAWLKRIGFADADIAELCAPQLAQFFTTGISCL